MPILSSNNLYSQSKIDFEEYGLDNGLHIILHRDNSNPVVSVNIWYHVGSKDEDPKRSGFAHLFEHMMFQGSKNVGKAEHFSYIQKAGGILNGTTSRDMTKYFQTVPSNQLELVLWLESDRMMSLNVTQENFDNQREVVKEEKRESYDNRPYGTWAIHMFNKAYQNHPYYMPPIGSMEDLNNASIEYAKSFYKRFYAPDNAVLVISGDIDYTVTKKLVQKYFDNIKPIKNTQKLYPDDNILIGEIRDTISDNVQLPALFIGYKIPGIKSKDIYALDMLSSLLSDGKSSRLYKTLVYEKKIAKSVNSFVWELELGGLLIITATGLKSSSASGRLEEIENQIYAEIEKLKKEAASVNELEKIKNSVESDFVNRMQTVMGKSDLLAHYWTFFKNTDMINTDTENFLNVTERDLSDAADKYLTQNNKVVLYYLPK
ncbi:MAG: M16 family metallopeptidase [Ignavibacteria bacterium]